MTQEKAKAIVLCVADEDGKKVGAIAVTDDSHLNVTSVIGDFNECLEELSKEFEIDDHPAVVDEVANAWLESGFEAFDPVSSFYDASTGTSVRKLLKFVTGKVQITTIGYIRFELNGVGEVKARLEDAIPVKTHEPAKSTPPGGTFS